MTPPAAAGWSQDTGLVMTVVSVRIVARMSTTDHIASVPGPGPRSIAVDLAALAERYAASEPGTGPGGDPAPAATVVRDGWAEDRSGAAVEAPGWCRVRVHGPAGALDVALPTERTVADLSAELAAHLLPGAPLEAEGPWRLHRLGQREIDPAAPFGAALPRDGDVFHLTGDAVPAPALVVDDALDALGRAAGETGRWGPAGMTAAGVAGAVGVSSALTVALALVRPAGVALPLVLAACLLAAALVMRREDDGGEVARGAAAGAALPAWAGAGAALGRLAEAGTSGVWALAGVALAVGAAVAATAVPTLLPLWAAPAVTGVLLTVGGALVATGTLGTAGAAALVGTVVLLGSAAAPWVVARSERWSSPEPPPGGAEQLAGAARRTRATLTAVSLSVSAAVAVCVLVLALGAGGSGLGEGRTSMARWLAVALAVVVALRARRSRFALESGAMLVAGLLPLGVLALVAVLLVGDGGRWGLVAVLAAGAGRLRGAGGGGAPRRRRRRRGPGAADPAAGAQDHGDRGDRGRGLGAAAAARRPGRVRRGRRRRRLPVGGRRRRAQVAQACGVFVPLA